MKDMRLLKLYNRLLKNDDIDVEEYAKENGVSTRTVERDIKCIKDFLADNEDKSRELIRIKRKKKYQLSYSEDSINLSKSEILAISKILLASRAFLKDEISLIVDKIAKQCGSDEDLDLIQELLKNEKFYYIELQHKKSFITHIWKLGQAIKDRKKVEIAYKKMDGNTVEVRAEVFGNSIDRWILSQGDAIFNLLRNNADLTKLVMRVGTVSGKNKYKRK